MLNFHMTYTKHLKYQKYSVLILCNLFDYSVVVGNAIDCLLLERFKMIKKACIMYYFPNQ